MSERSRHLHVAEGGEHLAELALAVIQRLAGAEHRGIALHDALHIQTDLGGAARALGMAQPVKTRERGLGAVRLSGRDAARPA